MSQATHQILEAALRLPENERAELAAHIMESFAPLPDDEDSAEVAAELGRRIEEIQRGDLKAIPWEETRRRLREGL